MVKPLLLENNILEIDYCVPVQGGLRIYMSGQTHKGVPFGSWKLYDLNGAIINEISDNHMTNIFGIKEK